MDAATHEIGEELKRLREENAKLAVLAERFADDNCTESGWYWYSTEYPEEGMCGPFESEESAASNAREVHREDAADEAAFAVREWKPEPTRSQLLAELDMLRGNIADLQRDLEWCDKHCPRNDP